MGKVSVNGRGTSRLAVETGTDPPSMAADTERGTIAAMASPKVIASFGKDTIRRIDDEVVSIGTGTNRIGRKPGRRRKMILPEKNEERASSAKEGRQGA